MELTAEQREIAVRAMLDVAQDRAIRPSQRIAAGGLLLRPYDAAYPDDDEVDVAERVQEDAYDELYDAIAERTIAKLEPLIDRKVESVMALIMRDGPS